MKRAENLNAPSLTGWALALAAGLVAFAVSKVIGGFDLMPSAFFGVLVALAAGLVMGMPWGGSAPVPMPAQPAKAEVEVAPKADAPAAPAATEAMPLVTLPAAGMPVAGEKPAASEVPPVAKAAAKAEVMAEGTKPAALAAPRGGVADDLKKIEGIGPALEKLCHELGIYHFDQIASWGAAEVAWMDGNLKGFRGRVTRDKWVAQAKLIGEVGMEEFLRRAKTNDY